MRAAFLRDLRLRRHALAALVAGAAAAALALHAPRRAPAERFFDARVVKVADGDTLEVVRDGGGAPLRIRLHGIDAPERGQPWSRRARQALADRALGKQVRINAVDTDRYGRTVGEVYADDVCVGCELVREGHVWVYLRFTQDPVLLALEAEARAARRGLWSLPEAERVPPWEWRERQRGAAPLR
jgi:endonuclease YncB( thermonuclease family)